MSKILTILNFNNQPEKTCLVLGEKANGESWICYWKWANFSRQISAFLDFVPSYLGGKLTDRMVSDST